MDDGRPVGAEAPVVAVTTHLGELPDGWGEHRRSVRRGGGVAALMLPAVAGATTLAVLWGSDSWWRGLVGLLLAVAAAPLLPVAGVPATTATVHILAGVVASAVLWLIVGLLAARRATRTPGASWPEWWREYRRLGVGVVIGGWAALVMAAAIVALRAR
jgi:hypothetical protein